MKAITSPSGGIRRAVATAVFLTIVWGIWNESFGVRTMVEGGVLSVVVLVATNRFLLRGAYHNVYRISPVTFLRYVGVLLVEIFRSGVHAIYVTITDRINVGVVDLPTEVSDSLVGVLVANAITLTPGTVTIDYDRKRFKVIWIDCVSTDPHEAGEMIKGSFERVFPAASWTEGDD
jgi:multicomponent Na+:H+ antiporter subunit E